MEIIERILKIMEEKNIKITDLSNELGINQSVVSAWKARKTNPPLKFAHQICNVLNVSPSYLLTGKEDTTYIFTEEQIDLINKYELLSDKNKGKVDQFILERLKEQ